MADQQAYQEAMRLCAGKMGDDIKETLEANGWKRLGNGAFKVAYAKADVIVKVGMHHDFTLNDSEGPFEWLTAYSATPQHLRQYLARVLGCGAYALIVERAPNVTGNTCRALQCEAAKRRLVAAWKAAGHPWSLQDGAHNHGHTDDGNPVWFDGL